MPRGKKRPHNALKHGAFAKAAILPGENQQEFDELHSALIEEWTPCGPTEEEAVLSIAKCIWRKRRVQNFLRTQALESRIDPNHVAYDAASMLASFSAYIEKAPESFATNLSALRESAAEHLLRTCPRDKFKTKSDFVAAVQKEITDVLLPAAARDSRFDPEWPLTDSAHILGQDIFKQELALDERIDAIIDRAIKRLIQTKAVKQMLVRTTLNDSEMRLVEKTSGRPYKKDDRTRNANQGLYFLRNEMVAGLDPLRGQLATMAASKAAPRGMA